MLVVGSGLFLATLVLSKQLEKAVLSGYVYMYKCYEWTFIEYVILSPPKITSCMLGLRMHRMTSIHLNFPLLTATYLPNANNRSNEAVRFLEHQNPRCIEAASADPPLHHTAYSYIPVLELHRPAASEQALVWTTYYFPRSLVVSTQNTLHDLCKCHIPSVDHLPTDFLVRAVPKHGAREVRQCHSLDLCQDTLVRRDIDVA